MATSIILSNPVDAFTADDVLDLDLTLDQYLRLLSRIAWLVKEDQENGLSREEEEELKALQWINAFGN